MRYLTILLLFVCTASHAQLNKAKYVDKLTTRLDYMRAYPIWQEMAQESISKGQANEQVIRQTYLTAMFVEDYAGALYWDSVLLSHHTGTSGDWHHMLELICMNQRHSDLSGTLDRGLMKLPNDPMLMKWKKHQPTIQSRLNTTTDYTIANFPTLSKGEVFSAFPYEKKVLYVSTDDEAHLIAPDYKRTGQEFMSICVYDSSAPKPKIWQKAFWGRIWYKNQWKGIDQNGLHDGPVSFNPDYTIAFVTHNHDSLDTRNFVEYARLEQRMYERNGDTWTQVDFPFNSKTWSTGHASMDSAGWVYFSSNRPSEEGWENYGGSDIYRTKKVEGKWLDPENLGKKINSEGNELFPFITSKGALYFSSNGWPGRGGLDIFMTDFEGNEPQHLGTPLNTNADDFAYYMDEETGRGFISSNREDWKDQIYAITKPIYQIDVKLVLENCKGKPVKGEKIAVTDTKTNKRTEYTTDEKGAISTKSLERFREYRYAYVGTSDLSGDSTVFSSGESGEFDLKLTTKFKQHISKINVKEDKASLTKGISAKIYRKSGNPELIMASDKGVLIYSEKEKNLIDSIVFSSINKQDLTFVFPKRTAGQCEDTVSYDIHLNDVDTSSFVNLDMIFYDFDKYNLRPESKVELEKLVAYMESHPEYTVELSSHTDCRGSYKYNETLSRNRSRSCVNYIIKKGIPKAKIIAEGYGEYKLRENCPCEGKVKSDCTEEQHQLNRRTELKLLLPNNEALDNNKLPMN
jgi:outer membrane protein OmpA-like peptidoglycan-associated protein